MGRKREGMQGDGGKREGGVLCLDKLVLVFKSILT